MNHKYPSSRQYYLDPITNPSILFAAIAHEKTLSLFRFKQSLSVFS